MTIDETIKHCIEAAAKNKTLASEIGEQLIGTPFEKYAIECQERATKYNQLAEWLRELKELRCLKSDYDIFRAEVIKELQEHIKQRILETAFNNGGIYGEVAEDIADRIDIWVDEFGRAKND